VEIAWKRYVPTRGTFEDTPEVFTYCVQGGPRCD
jgi:hypothetical protein